MSASRPKEFFNFSAIFCFDPCLNTRSIAENEIAMSMIFLFLIEYASSIWFKGISFSVPNGLELSCPAAQASDDAFSRNPTGKPRFNFPHACRVSLSDLFGGEDVDGASPGSTLPLSYPW